MSTGRGTGSVLSRFRAAGLLSAIPFLLPASPAAADVRLEAGGGVFVPYEVTQRDVFGSSPSFGVAVSSAFGDKGGRVFLEVAHARGSGDELTPDATFETGLSPTTFRLWPVTLGLRFDLNRTPVQDLRLFFGLGVRTVFTRARGPDWSDSSPTYGTLVELRPEYLLDRRWSVWLRQRLDVLRDGPSRTDRTLDYSAATLEMGLSFSLDNAPFALPRETP